VKSKLAAAISLLCLITYVVPMLAHHSVESQFDVNKILTIKGRITRIEWMNPHARIWVDAKNADGTVSSWEMELPPPHALQLHDVRIDFVKQGDQVSVDLWRAKDGSKLANALTVTLPDGRVLDFPRLMRMPVAINPK
jgi:hypothetical protein